MEQNILMDLRSINGYLGSALTTYRGDILLSDFYKVMGGIKEASVNFNTAFRIIHAISTRFELGHSNAIAIEMDRAIIIKVCSGMDSRVHLHLFALFRKDASIAFAKKELSYMMKRVLGATN